MSILGVQAEVNHLPFRWQVTDENLASGLCYTSGTTGNPKVRHTPPGTTGNPKIRPYPCLAWPYQPVLDLPHCARLNLIIMAAAVSASLQHVTFCSLAVVHATQPVIQPLVHSTPCCCLGSVLGVRAGPLAAWHVQRPPLQKSVWNSRLTTLSSACLHVLLGTCRGCCTAIDPISCMQ